MTTTKDELEKLKNECITLNNKLNELSENELKLVTGGLDIDNLTEEELRELFNDTTHNAIE